MPQILRARAATWAATSRFSAAPGLSRLFSAFLLRRAGDSSVPALRSSSTWTLTSSGGDGDGAFDEPGSENLGRSEAMLKFQHSFRPDHHACTSLPLQPRISFRALGGPFSEAFLVEQRRLR